jgi:uncharacterized protein with von Willebrand factor type A (vWA) domain
MAGVDVAGVDVAEVAGRLGGLLHAAGVAVTPERAGRLAAVMGLAMPLTYAEMYWAARVTLVSGHEQIEVFDRVFAQVFGGLADPAEFRGDAPPPPPPTAPGQTRPGGPDTPPLTVTEDLDAIPRSVTPTDDVAVGEGERETVLTAVSEEERLRNKDFGTMTPEELARLRALTARLAFATPPRRSRRQVRSAGGRDLDVRATLRRARRTGGDPMKIVRRRRRVRFRRLVLLCDISGSMEPYTRAYLQLLVSGVGASSAGGSRVEAFVFATRLTRLTRALRQTTPALALERAGRAAPDWSGGTRIGPALKVFNDDHARRGLARGAVVVVISDGWDRGDPELLGREMARLRRLCHRLIWVNPRRAAPGYQPLTAGMAAALPHVDAFLSGHSLAAFDEVLAAIAGEVSPPGR